MVLLDTNVVIRHLESGKPTLDWQNEEYAVSTITVAEEAARLGRTRKKKLPDLLIAATALDLGSSLMTENKKDFRGISGLKIKS